MFKPVVSKQDPQRCRRKRQLRCFKSKDVWPVQTQAWWSGGRQRPRRILTTGRALRCGGGGRGGGTTLVRSFRALTATGLTHLPTFREGLITRSYPPGKTKPQKRFAGFLRATPLEVLTKRCVFIDRKANVCHLPAFLVVVTSAHR